MSSEEDWRRYHGPIGDAVQALFSVESTKCGYARALDNWTLAREKLSPSRPSAGSTGNAQITPSQLHSLRLLEEWWEGCSQQKSLTRAAVDTLQAASRRDSEPGSTWTDYASRRDARLTESTYHAQMFILFELEFVVEARLMLARPSDDLPSTLHFLREKCSKLAALQRIAHEVVIESSAAGSQPTEHGNTVERPILDVLRNAIPATVNPCPWLYDGDAKVSLERPYFLWDVRDRRTAVVGQLPAPPPEYICVSHTWGRWRKEKEPLLSIPGVPWLVPQNSKFEVASLPDQLERAFKTGYVWFDLLCIPQDESVLGSQEISRQAVIFRNATGVVTWMNDVPEWRVMPDVVRWYALFYLHTNVNAQPGEPLVPDMPQPDEADYPNMELYDWSTGDVSSVRLVDGVPDDESLTPAAPMPWFISLWTLQELCLRPGLVLCDKSWRPLCFGHKALTLDTLVSFETFIAGNEFAKSVTRPGSELGNPSYTGLPPLPGMSFPDIIQPRGCSDMTTLFVDTHVNQVMTISPAAVFSFGQFRKCTSRRGEAIMSVVGATEWYKGHLQQFQAPPPETDLVLDFYPLGFVQEAARKIGPTFFTSIPTELRHLEGVVDLSSGLWRFCEDPPAVGSMLPFSRSPGYFRPPSAPSLGERAHPAVKEWEILLDGSVVVRRAGILQVGMEDYVEAIVYAPLYDVDDKVHYMTEVRPVDEVNLGGWLEDFSNPELAPNLAVSLYQMPSLMQEETAGMHVGLLLKSCGSGALDGQLKLVKVGMFFTKDVDISDVQTSEVDWIIL